MEIDASDLIGLGGVAVGIGGVVVAALSRQWEQRHWERERSQVATDRQQLANDRRREELQRWRDDTARWLGPLQAQIEISPRTTSALVQPYADMQQTAYSELQAEVLREVVTTIRATAVSRYAFATGYPDDTARTVMKDVNTNLFNYLPMLETFEKMVVAPDSNRTRAFRKTLGDGMEQWRNLVAEDLTRVVSILNELPDRVV